MEQYELAKRLPSKRLSGNGKGEGKTKILGEYSPAGMRRAGPWRRERPDEPVGGAHRASCQSGPESGGKGSGPGPQAKIKDGKRAGRPGGGIASSSAE